MIYIAGRSPHSACAVNATAVAERVIAWEGDTSSTAVAGARSTAAAIGRCNGVQAVVSFEV